MSDDGQEQRSAAAAAMGRARSPRKTDSGRENAAKAREARWSKPGAHERLSAAMKASWERRKAAEAAKEGQDA